MEEESTNRAWAQPLTFGGVAQFGLARAGVLVSYQLATAVLAAAAICVFFELAWVPVLERAIASLPRTGAIENGQLAWTERTPLRTTGSSFLWIGVDPAGVAEAGEGADLQVEAGQTALRIRSIFGHLAVPYLKGYRIALNRTELEPWWGAWHPAVVAGLGGTVVIGLFISWAVLGVVYSWPVWLIAFYADRRLSWFGAWKIGAACLLPGALFLSLSIVGYTLHRMNLVQLLAAALLHIMIGWVYVLFAPFNLPEKDPDSRHKQPAGNPFGSPTVKSSNPFSHPPQA
jgi:hypothetical protein